MCWVRDFQKSICRKSCGDRNYNTGMPISATAAIESRAATASLTESLIALRKLFLFYFD